jgi:hypothetical protein
MNTGDLTTPWRVRNVDARAPDHEQTASTSNSKAALNLVYQ